MALDQGKGVWKSGKGKGRRTPKGRQLDDTAHSEIRKILAGMPLRRDLLIEYLHLIQDKFGHLSAAHLRALAEEMKLSQAEIFEVASFYAHFDIIREGETAPPALTLRVCDSLSCELAGSADLLRELATRYSSKEVRVLRAPCMGRCETAPVVALGHNHITNADYSAINTAVKAGKVHGDIAAYEEFEEYSDDGGYKTLQSLRAGAKTVDQVQDEILQSGLRGLGGAGFPSGRKWSFVRAADGPRYLAVNADEGEPGTFKDRYYLEREPHVFLEGMLIAAWAVDAQTAFIYLRDEYPEIQEILLAEIKKLEAAGIVETGYIDLRRGAGAYICGEESAMIESIEGKRGMPRHRPPYVAQVGVFGRPTLVHNVETLYWITKVCRGGPEILNSHERNGRKGLRSYSVSGRVKFPGVQLLPAGSTISDIIKACGGMMDGHEFTAYSPGGPSSGLLPASMHDIPLDFDVLQEYGSFIGSAAVVVLSDQDSVRDAVLNMLRFFEDESCGQCTPCRIGCEKAVKLMQVDRWDQGLLTELCTAMMDASICGLGQAAPNPILSLMKYFPDQI
ncbi:MAG: NAD(P)H-dependent oxidoreductase subunit E [Rhodobacteraceae bacterium]|nr:NAD(P)H-dependent oxidoreductase subunit E [Paracoccaceae bacterium]